MASDRDETDTVTVVLRHRVLVESRLPSSYRVRLCDDDDDDAVLAPGERAPCAALPPDGRCRLELVAAADGVVLRLDARPARAASRRRTTWPYLARRSQ